MNDVEEVTRLATIGRDAVSAALKDDQSFAVIVIVRKLPFPGMPLGLTSNITSGTEHVLRIVNEARDVMMSDKLVKL